VDCDGQVLVIDDVVGLYPKTPKFAKKYTDSRDNISTAVKKYLNEVKLGVFPDKEHSF
jgi:3-methyl-2-oxobutanoate hydroxymethyltransferase